MAGVAGDGPEWDGAAERRWRMLFEVFAEPVTEVQPLVVLHDRSATEGGHDDAPVLRERLRRWTASRALVLTDDPEREGSAIGRESLVTWTTPAPGTGRTELADLVRSRRGVAGAVVVTADVALALEVAVADGRWEVVDGAAGVDARWAAKSDDPPIEAGELVHLLAGLDDLRERGELSAALARALLVIDDVFADDADDAQRVRMGALMTLAALELAAGDAAAPIDHAAAAVRAARTTGGVHIPATIAWSVGLVTQASEPRTLAALSDELCTWLEADGLAPEFESGVAQIRDHQAHALETMGEHRGALAAFEASVALRRRVLERDPDDVGSLMEMARGANGLGSLMLRLGLPGARPLLEEALEVRRRQIAVGGRRPEAIRDLAGNYVFVGDALRSEGDPLAIGYYEEAAGLERDLVAAHPEVLHFAAGLTTSLDRIRRERARQGDLDAALAAGEEQLAVQRRLAAARPTPEQHRDLHIALLGVAWIVEQTGDLARMNVLEDEALAIARRVAAARPDWALAIDDLAVSLSRVAFNHEQRGDLDAAWALHEESAAARRQLVARSGDTVRTLEMVAEGCRGRARVLRAQGREADVLALGEEVVAIRERTIELFGDHPDRLRELAAAWRDVATSQRRLHGPGLAAAAFAQAAAVFRRLFDTMDRTPQRYADLASTLADMANGLFSEGDVDGARDCFREAVDLQRERLVLFSPTIPARRELTRFENGLGRILVDDAQFAAAIEVFRPAGEERQRLLAEAASMQRHYDVLLGIQNHIVAAASSGRADLAEELLAIGQRSIDAYSQPDPERAEALQLQRLGAWLESVVAEATADRSRWLDACERTVDLAERYQRSSPGHVADDALGAALMDWGRAVLVSGVLGSEGRSHRPAVGFELAMARLSRAADIQRALLAREATPGRWGSLGHAVALQGAVLIEAAAADHRRGDEGAAAGVAAPQSSGFSLLIEGFDAMARAVHDRPGVHQVRWQVGAWEAVTVALGSSGVASLPHEASERLHRVATSLPTWAARWPEMVVLPRLCREAGLSTGPGEP